MICKTFEIRDIGTFIPVMAIKLEPGCERDRFLLARAGYGRDARTQSGYIALVTISGGEGKFVCDAHEWPSNPRTWGIAHQYIENHFDQLESGAVIDVEFILGEQPKAKLSEQITTGGL